MFGNHYRFIFAKMAFSYYVLKPQLIDGVNELMQSY